MRVVIICLQFRIRLKENPKVALVNTKITEEDALETLNNPSVLLTIENRVKLFEILNEAKKRQVDLLVFPEFYLSIEWLMDISFFAVRNGISIVTGMQYLTYKDQAYNNVCTVIPIVTGWDGKFINGIFTVS